MSPREYNRKRDFRKTREPKGKIGRRPLHRFVIQKHAASRLHYDFRLEMDGTLKSWAVPKGMPYTKGEKHLAVQVEDHPLEYINFEGTIPKGQYGGGTVMVWDRGTYEPLTEQPSHDLSEGKLHFVLHGQKLEGEWYLVRMRDGKNWLLVRGHGDLPPPSPKFEDSSAISGRTMEAIGRTDAVWESHRPQRRRLSSAPRPKATLRRRSFRQSSSALPAFIEPMKARLASRPPTGKWAYEIKYDGFRALAFKQGNSVRLLSRNNKDLGGRFPQIQRSVASLSVNDAIFDGEIVAVDPQGRSSFQLLQALALGKQRPPSSLLRFRSPAAGR